MKKTRFLVLALAVAIMLMGAGYAWWTETVVIHTDVTTGKLEVEIDDASASADRDILVAEPVIGTDIFGRDQVKFKFDDMYPGSSAVAVVKVKNTGTMAVRIDSPIFTWGDGDAGSLTLWDLFSVDDVTFTPSASGDGRPIALTKHIGIDGNAYYTLDESNPVLIEPNEYAVFTINVKMNESVSGEEDLGDIWFTFQPTFKQYNDPY